MQIIQLFPLIFLTGCLAMISDPVYNNDISICPGKIFVPEMRKAPCLELTKIQENHKYSLGELIDIGLQNNPSTKTAWFDAKAQAFNYYASESNYLPNINLEEALISDDAARRFKVGATPTGTISGGGTTVGGIGGLGYSLGLSHTLTVQYLLFDFGTRSGLVEAAKQALIAADWQHHFVLQQVMYDVAITYYNYLEAQAFIVSSEQNLANAKLAMDAANAQFEAGIKTKVDLLQATSNYYNAELDAQNRKAEAKVAMANLANSLGIAPNSILDVEKVPFEIQPRPIQEGIEELMEYARTKRADLAAQEAIVFQRLADIQTARGNALPTLSTDVSLNSTRFYKGSVINSHDYMVALVLDIPLFNGFNDYNQLRQAKAFYEAAYFDWQTQENTILANVIAAYYQYVTSNENLKTTTEYLSFAEEAFNSVLGGYQEGIQTIIDLISAQNTLADASAKLIQSRANWLSAIVNIAFTTGLIGVDAKELSIADPRLIEGESP